MIIWNHFFIQNCILVHLFYQYSSNASYCLLKSSNFLLIWGSISRCSEPPHVWGAQGTARSLDPWLVREIFIVCIGPYKYHLVLWVRKEIDALDKCHNPNNNCRPAWAPYSPSNTWVLRFAYVLFARIYDERLCQKNYLLLENHQWNRRVITQRISSLRRVYWYISWYASLHMIEYISPWVIST